MGLEGDPLKSENKNPDLRGLPVDDSAVLNKDNSIVTGNSTPTNEKPGSGTHTDLGDTTVTEVTITGIGNTVGDGNTVSTVHIETQINIGSQGAEELLRHLIKTENPNKSKQSREQDEESDSFPKQTKRIEKKQKEGSTSKKSARSSLKDLGSPREWFDRLTENQKLYALLVVLLKDLDREILDTIYISAVDKLRQNDLSSWLNDARTLGLDDLLDSLMATEKNGIVQLLPDYEAEVKRQINNRYHLLWSIFENLLADNEKEIAFTDWEFREKLGHAIGHVGLRYPNKLENLLQKFVNHPSHRIVVIAGYALAEIARLESAESKLYERILDKWVSSKRPHHSWAAAASIWRIYLINHRDQTVRNVLWKHIETLIDDIDDLDTKTKNDILLLIEKGEEPQVERYLRNLFWEKVDVISNALNNMFTARPDDVVAHLTAWLKSDEQDKRSFISQRAIGEILNRLSRQEIQSLEEVRWGLKLLPSVLEVDDDDLTDIAFSALKVWLESDVFDQDNKQEIVRLVAEVIDRSHENALYVFRKKLVEFCFASNVGANDALTVFSIDLITRTYFADGYPIIPSDLGSLVLLADATPEGKELNSLALISRINPLVAAVVDVYVYIMGYSKLVGKPGNLFQNGDQLIWHDLPRLMTSALADTSNKAPRNPAWLAAFSYGPIVDGIDVFTKYLDVNMLDFEFYKPKEEEQWGNESRIVVIDCSAHDGSTPDQWIPLTNDICLFLVKNISQKAPDEFWKAVNSYVSGKPTVNNAMDQIRAVFNKLHNGDAIERKDYYVASCLFWWLQKRDSASALKICLSWLGDIDTEDYAGLYSGICFGKFLLRTSLYLEMPTNGIADLSLALLSVAPDWTTFDLILRNIEKQYRTASPSSGVEAIDPSTIISHLSPALRSRMSFFLDTWIKDDKSPSALRKYGERLKLFISIGLLSVSPDVEENRKFGLVFVDGDLSDGQFLDYAIDFIAELEKTPLGEKVVPVLYRLGQKVPLAVGYGKPEMSDIKFSSPNFINPLLDAYPVEKVLFRTIMIKHSIYDFDDNKQNWSSVPTIIFDKQRQAKFLEAVNLLYMSPVDSNTKENLIPDAIGVELTRMINAHS